MHLATRVWAIRKQSGTCEGRGPALRPAGKRLEKSPMTVRAQTLTQRMELTSRLQDFMTCDLEGDDLKIQKLAHGGTFDLEGDKLETPAQGS